MTTTHKKIDWIGVRQRLDQFQLQDGKSEPGSRDRLKEVYHQRAERLALRGRADATPARQDAFIVFRLRTHRIGVQLTSVKQVFPRVPITPIPGAGKILLGVANLNGSIRSIIDLRVQVNLPTMELDTGYIILLRAGDKLLGIWAETIEGISQIDLTRISAVDEAVSESIGQIATGMTDGRILLLDANRLIEQLAEQRRRHENKM